MTHDSPLRWRDHLAHGLACYRAHETAAPPPVDGQPVRAISGHCPCLLTTRLPFTVEWWRPDLDDEPGPPVQAVARYGEDPTLRRVVRTEHGWVEHGCLIESDEGLTTPMAWERTGRCWAGTPHPVVACEP